MQKNCFKVARENSGMWFSHLFSWLQHKKENKKTCSHLVMWQPAAPAGIKPGQTQNLCFVDYTKCRSTLLIQIWVLAFCLCTSLFFLPYSVEQNLTLTLVVSKCSCLPCIARCQPPGDCMKILLSLFSILWYSISPRKGTWWETNVYAGRINLHLKFVIWQRSATRFCNS